jgi:hypothetical protein
LRQSSRQTVDFGRLIAWAIAPIEWPKALASFVIRQMRIASHGNTP